MIRGFLKHANSAVNLCLQCCFVAIVESKFGFLDITTYCFRKEPRGTELQKNMRQESNFRLPAK